MPSRLVTSLLGIVLSWPLLVMGGSTAAVADCGPQRRAWPQDPAQVRGLAFVGTVTEVGEGTSTAGPPAWFRVDLVLDGAVDGEITIDPVCVGTAFVPGRQYLVSTSGTVTDGRASIDDTTAVAWSVALDGTVSLVSDDGNATPSAPAWLHDPRTLDDAIQALVPGGAAVTHEWLGSRWSNDPSGRVALLRTTLAPGAAMPPTVFAGEWLVRVEDGVLDLTLVDGAASLQYAEGIDVGEGVPIDLRAGRVLETGPNAVMRWENHETQPVTLLSVASIPGDTAAMVEFDSGARASAFADPVVRRRILTDRGLTGDESRITIADRSGQLVGARIPTQRELRFAGPGLPSRDDTDLRIGPIASLDGNQTEVLLRWSGTPCGPVVRLDIAKDLSAMRLTDRTPGCDAAAVRYAMVVRLRGQVPAVEDIELSSVRS